MTHTQPEALRLADKYEVDGFLQEHRFAKDFWCRQAAVELRRQHARIEELEAHLAAAQQGVQGWKLVPVEPTEKMINEGSCAQTLKDGHQYIGGCAAKTAWTFMLAAAPKPSRKTNP